MSRKKHFLTQTQLESLTSPTRLAIIQRLEIDKQATARELAQQMGRPVTSLYHHLKQLREAGILRVATERKGARRPEAVYATVADYLSSAEAVKTQHGKETYARAAARVAEAAVRGFSVALARGSPRFAGKHRNAMVKYYHLRADKKKIARLNSLLDELDEAGTHSSEEGEDIQLTILFSPLQRKG